MELSLTDSNNLDSERRSRTSGSKRRSAAEESDVVLHPIMATAGLVFAARNDFQVTTHLLIQFFLPMLESLLFH